MNNRKLPKKVNKLKRLTREGQEKYNKSINEKDKRRISEVWEKTHKTNTRGIRNLFVAKYTFINCFRCLSL